MLFAWPVVMCPSRRRCRAYPVKFLVNRFRPYNDRRRVFQAVDEINRARPRLTTTMKVSPPSPGAPAAELRQNDDDDDDDCGAKRRRLQSQTDAVAANGSGGHRRRKPVSQGDGHESASPDRGRVNGRGGGDDDDGNPTNDSTTGATSAARRDNGQVWEASSPPSPASGDCCSTVSLSRPSRPVPRGAAHHSPRRTLVRRFLHVQSVRSVFIRL